MAIMTRHRSGNELFCPAWHQCGGARRAGSPECFSKERAPTMLVFPLNVMQIKKFSLFPLAFAIAAGTLVPGSVSFAAAHHRTRPAAHNKAAAEGPALAPLAAQSALAAGAPALPA